MMPLIRNTATSWRSDFLAESLIHGDAPPTWCELRTRDYAYTVYQYRDGTKERELYDLNKDPDELKSVATDSAYSGAESNLENRLAQLCNPPPPGTSLP